jgi:hypothetical protein
MPLPLIGLGVGAALGLGKNILDQENYRDQMKTVAATTRYSPWTGMKAQAPTKPSLANSMFQGASAGGMMQQSLAGGTSPVDAAKSAGQSSKLGVGNLNDEVDGKGLWEAYGK